MQYYVDIRHDGSNKFRRISGNDKYVVEQKAQAQMALWDEAWERKQAVEEKKRAVWDRQGEAADRTKEAIQEMETIEKVLLHTLDIDDAVDWEILKLPADFQKSKPIKPKLASILREPKRSDEGYVISTSQELFSLVGLSKAKQQANDRFETDLKKWEEEKDRINKSNTTEEGKYNESLQGWMDEKGKYPIARQEVNQAVENQKKKYQEKDPDAILDYCDIVLTNSEYPDYFPREYDMDFNSNNGILIVEYRLPDISDLPRLKEVKYNRSQDVFKEYFLSDSAFNKLYDSLVYQICLRTIHELIEADIVDAIRAAVFNGWVKSIDKATGQEVTTCIVSLQAKREEFLEINLRNVDPKACFKNLKGVGSSKLHGLVAIQPLINISREDKRFVEGRDVADGLSGGENIAAMPWDDFEHLIRELFEKEFNQTGGEVKVTQASRDGGVDAVAFDPDPIRGGKIVIQAKRYTNTVGLSAVRDLYGTVINEGATKGILISTADYGPDAYEFSKGKPLTLLNGGHLLHLLEKHGHQAKIDLAEAKKILKEQESG